MHRDLKLGLALAVLLIGATTAFFFRNETEPDGGLPRLQNPERLDVEIASREAVPYLGQPESDPAEDPAAAASPWTKPAFLGGTSALIRRTSVMPDPIRIEMDDDAEPIDDGPALTPEPSEPAIEVAVGGVHVVQSGDTLTGLAARYLGSIARFEEIYELNRDRLSGPNALRVGMELRIPAVEAAEAADAVAGEAAVEAEPEEAVVSDTPETVVEAEEKSDEAAPAESAEKLFVPARKTPFVPGRYRGAGTPSAESVKAGDAERE